MDLLQIDESSHGFAFYNLIVSTRYAHKMDSYPYPIFIMECLFHFFIIIMKSNLG